MLKRKQKGFTLIELLVVIAILSVLALVAIPSIMGLMGIGDEAIANTEASTVRVAILAWSVENDNAIANGEVGPDDLGGLDPYIDKDLRGSYTIVDGDITDASGWERLEWQDDHWVKSEG